DTTGDTGSTSATSDETTSEAASSSGATTTHHKLRDPRKKYCAIAAHYGDNPKKGHCISNY
ncbi:MAG: hypothetical protein M3290_07705, partial [Actinomycetota bacterium]|nr:hypothetical protein [Actinomycetota bacterium]